MRDKVETIPKYLKGKARQMVGDYHETVGEALGALVDPYGHLKVIWAASKTSMEKAVSNYS